MSESKREAKVGGESGSIGQLNRAANAAEMEEAGCFDESEGTSGEESSPEPDVERMVEVELMEESEDQPKHASARERDPGCA